MIYIGIDTEAGAWAVAADVQNERFARIN